MSMVAKAFLVRFIIANAIQFIKLLTIVIISSYFMTALF